MPKASRHTPVPGWTPPTLRERLRLLSKTRSVAIVGASSNPARPSYFVAAYLVATTDFDVYFVNPGAEEILGRPAYASLRDLPVTPDLVDVFRRPEDLPTVAQEAIEVGAQTLWMQLGLWSPEAAQLASRAGLDVVMNRCIKIEHARFHGGLHLAGFDTGVIDSRRPPRRTTGHLRASEPADGLQQVSGGGPSCGLEPAVTPGACRLD